MWWTMNCKYNAAYDVQRLNVKSKIGDASVNDREPGDLQERFLFTRENPDLVAYMLALRTELLMRIVMPSVVKHSDAHPYMCMARAEVGSNGNPHYHGFSMGTPGPRVVRVHADIDGKSDMPPETLSGDLRVVLRSFDAEPGIDAWPDNTEKMCAMCTSCSRDI